MEGVDELDANEDPKQMAAMMRKFGDASGLEFGPRMQEMMSRLEAGEDPDSLEEELGDDLDDDAIGEFFRLRKRSGRSAPRPRVDDTLYFL